MRVRDMFPRRYLTGSDLGQPTTFTIARVQFEEMRINGQLVRKPVIRFENIKQGVVLCRQLAEQIAEAVGTDETDDWPGRRVTLYPVQMDVAGRPVVAIRVYKQPPPGPEAPTARRQHWIDNPIVFQRFWTWIGELGLTEGDVLAALGVDDIHHYPGSMAEAKCAIERYSRDLNGETQREGDLPF